MTKAKKHHNTCISQLFALTLFVLAFSLLFPCVSVSAEESDVRPICTLNIVMKTSSGELVPEGTMAIYRVADLTYDNGYSWEIGKQYDGCNFPEDGLWGNSHAKELAVFVRTREISGETNDIDKDGKVSFQDLTSGVFLVVQTQAGADYYEAEPFFVILPFYSDTEGKYIFDVTVYPKAQHKGLTHTVTTSTDNDKPQKLPQTGQLMTPIYVLIAGGFIFILISFILRKKYEK